MTPTEKAKKLIERFEGELVIPPTYGTPKGMALICVSEIIEHCSQVEPFLGVDYWNEVKNELNKL